MKVIWTVLIVVLIAGLMCWVRGGADFSFVRALPFLGGHPPGVFDFGAICLCVITVWGLARLRRNRDDDE